LGIPTKGRPGDQQGYNHLVKIQIQVIHLEVTIPGEDWANTIVSTTGRKRTKVINFTMLSRLEYLSAGSRFHLIRSFPLLISSLRITYLRAASGLAKFRDIPNLPPAPGVVDHPKTTMGNLSNLLAMLISYINSLMIEEGPEIVGSISTFLDYIMTRSGSSSVELIKELKEVRTYFIGILRGAPLPAGFKGSFSFLSKTSYTVTHSHFSQILQLKYKLYGTVKMTKDSVTFDRIILAVLDSSRVISLSATPNYDTITGESTSTADMEAIKKEVSEAIKLFPFTPAEVIESVEDEVRRWEHVVTEKAGPNGPATRTSGGDAYAIYKDDKLMSHFFEFCRDMNMMPLFFNLLQMAMAQKNRATDNLNATLVTSRLHAIQELGGKVRIVGILDYYTQRLLDPLHKALGRHLSSLGPDAVYNQDKASDQVRLWTSRGLPIYSYDLSAATDRMPLSFQTWVLGIFIGSQSKAENWANLLTDRSFASPDGVSRRYKVGQPMGAKSSFVVFDLSHHVIVQVAARRAGFKVFFQDYVIIGDDITIAHPKVAAHYRGIIESLGITINLSKSVVHSEGMASAGEMAKRLFIDGVELSVFPVKLLARLPRFGKLGVIIQDFITRRTGIKPNRPLLAFLGSGMDSDSLETLIKINSVPADIVGLHSVTGPLYTSLEISKWSDKVTLTEKDIIDAYTFTVIAEQLKRLEALIRQAEIINTRLRSVGQADIEALESMVMTKPQKEAVLAESKLLFKDGPNGPSWQAALSEANRVGQVLAQLRSGTVTVTRAARLGLLDSLRNSIWTRLDNTAEERSQITYSVFTTALTNLGHIVDKPAVDAHGKPVSRVLEFTIPILSLSRSYTVYWSLGGGVYVNMVKARVVTDHLKSVSKLDTIGAGVSMLSKKSPKGS